MTIVKILVAAVLAAYACGGSLLDATADWLVVATFDSASAHDSTDERVELTCSLQQHDALLSGSCRPTHGPDGVQVSGTAHGEKIEWSFQIAMSEKAPKQTATFRGTLAGRGLAINGTFAIGDAHGRFDATRQQ